MISIRRATMADIETIVRFQVKMAHETEGLQLNEATVIRGVNFIFQNNSHGSYFVAEVDEKVVASLLLTPEWSDWRNGWVMWIQSLYVVPERRRQGIFKKLYKHVQEMVKRNPGMRGVRLYVDRNNLPAQKVYLSIGMDGGHYRLFEWMAGDDTKC